MRRTLLAAVVIAGCAPIGVDDIVDFDAEAFPTTDATVFDGFPVDVASPDVGPIGPPFNGGGPFQCFDCVCDGTLNLCFHGGGGGAPIDDAGDDADASDADVGDADDADAGLAACAFDAGQTYCQPIPIECLPKPTCGCIESVWASCTCGVDPSGNGFVVVCPPNP